MFALNGESAPLSHAALISKFGSCPAGTVVTSAMRHCIAAKLPPAFPAANAVVENLRLVTGKPADPVYETVRFNGAAASSVDVMTVPSMYGICVFVVHCFNRATIPAKSALNPAATAVW